jgi:ABC-type transport system involved in resistance to organic solvents, permease component
MGVLLLMELSPVITALVMTGRVGASIAAEIGTMRVSEQIDALETLSFDPVSFLIMPRVISGAIMFPVMVVIADFFGLLGGFFAATTSIGISSYDYVYGLRDWFVPWYAIFGIIKAFSFGVAITSLACYFGYYTSGGAEGVGKSTTTNCISFLYNYCNTKLFTSCSTFMISINNRFQIILVIKIIQEYLSFTIHQGDKNCNNRFKEVMDKNDHVKSY